MKVICLRENLKKSVNLIERATTQNPTLPILKNFLLRKEKDRLYLIATDLEIAAKSWMDIKSESEEKIETTIPISTFSNFLNNLFEEKLTLEIEKDFIVIQTQNLKTKIQGLEAKDFPIIPKVKKENKVQIDPKILKNAFDYVMGASNVSSSRPEITGVLFHFTGEEIFLAATDNFRLAQKIILPKYFKTDLKDAFKLLIPLKAIYEFNRVVEILDVEKYIDIYFDSNQILFEFPNLEIISRLINANFPEYQDIIPKKFDAKIILDKEKIVSAIRLASVFSSQVNDLKIKIPENLKHVEIFTQEASKGENKIFIDGQIEGKGLEITFNYKYLLDGIRPIKGDKVFLGLSGRDSNKPSLIRDGEDESYIYLLMPINI